MSSTNPQLNSPKLTLFQKLRVKLFGSCKIGYIKEEGWRDKIPLFAFYCNKHGIISSVPMGFNQMLVCPSCLEEMKLYKELEELEILQNIDDAELIRSQQDNVINH